jgi:hypothetical protein
MKEEKNRRNPVLIEYNNKALAEKVSTCTLIWLFSGCFGVRYGGGGWYHPSDRFGFVDYRVGKCDGCYSTDEAEGAEFEKYKQIPQYQQMNAHFTLSDFKFIFFWNIYRLSVGDRRSVYDRFIFSFSNRRSPQADEAGHDVPACGIQGFLDGIWCRVITQRAVNIFDWLSPTCFYYIRIYFLVALWNLQEPSNANALTKFEDSHPPGIGDGADYLRRF